MRARLLSWLFLPCALAFFAGCPSDPAPIPEPGIVRILSFTASPQDLPEGGMVTVRWETEGAESVTLHDSNRGAVSGAEAPKGEVTVQVDRTTLFVLTARSFEGRTTSAIAQVKAGPGDAEAILVAQPSVVPQGGAVTLAWTTTRPHNVRLTTSDGTPVDMAGQTASGTVTVHPTADTTYVLESAGRRVETTVRIRPDIVSFKATPTGAVPGQPLVLSWQTTGASKVTLEEVEREVLHTTEVAGEVAQGSFSVPVALVVPKDRVFNFRLRAEGGTSGVAHEALVTVYVAGQSRFLSLDLPRYARKDETFTVRWQTAEADKVVIRTPEGVVYQTLDEATARAGSAVLPTPAVKTTYVVEASSFRGGLASESRDISPVVTTEVVSATATPDSVAGGTPVTLAWHISGARQVKVTHTADGTVFTGSGDEMENTSITLYPNTTGAYEILADNTLGDSAKVTVPVTITQPATFGLSTTGSLFTGDKVTLSHPGPAGATTFVGFPHDEIDHVAGAADATFIDISETAERAPFTGTADASNRAVQIDFETWLYAERVAGNMVVFTDGYFVLGPFAKSKTGGANFPIPGNTHEPSLIAPFWDDLVFGAESALMWEVRGEAPNKVLIVQWDEVQLKGDPDTSLTFQAQVYQTGRIVFAYRKVNAPGATPTIGVQGPVADRGIEFAAPVATGDVLTFFGERGPEFELTLDRAGPFSAFVPVGSTYMRVPLTIHNFVPPNGLVISEAMPVPHASLGTGGEWVEVMNLTGADVDLNGWTLQSGSLSHVIQAAAGQNTIVPAGGILVLGATKSTTDNGGVPVDYEWDASFTLDDATFVGLAFGNYATDLVYPGAPEGISKVADHGGYRTVGDTGTTAPHEIFCEGSTVYGDVALDQRGSPGVRKGCFGYRVVSRPVDYRDISATGVGLTRTDLGNNVDSVVVSVDGSGATAFGQPLSSLTISRHGFVTFNGTATTTYKYGWVVAPAAATPDFTAAIFAQTLGQGDGSSGARNSNTYIQRFEPGEDPQNPEGHWIIQWHKMRVSNILGVADDLNFQMKLFDDGAIEYHYGAMVSGDSNEHARGGGAVVWLEAPDGNAAQVISVLSPSIRPFTAFRFIPE